MNYWLILIPVISAFIGWFTNWIAIKMLFHPRNPVNVLGIRIQGIFPKRQDQFAEKLGKLVAEQLISFKEIEQKVTDPENLKEILPHVESHIDEFLRVRLGKAMPMISMFIGDKTINELKKIFMEELENIFPQVMTEYMAKLQQQLNLEQIVAHKVKAFSTDKLELILLQIMSKEFRFVEILGGVLGFIIGIVQVLITFLTA